MGPFFLRAVELVLAVQAMQATVAGTVRDAETGLPLVGVVVALTELDRAAATDADGRYVLRQVPAGPHHLTVRFIGYAPRSLHALVPVLGQLEINVSLRAEPVRLRPIAVHGTVPGAGRITGDSLGGPDRRASMAEIRNHPLLAEPDAFQVLSGGEVALRPESPGGVHVRGGAADQTAYLIDGVPVFSPYHAAGLFSAWNPDALSEVKLWSVLPSPASSHAMSGIVEGITLTPGLVLRSQGTVSSTQARVTFDGPLGRGPRFLVGVRTSFPGVIAPRNEATYLHGETQDILAKIEAPVAKGQFRLLAYGAGNEIRAASVVAAEDTGGQAFPPNVFDWQGRSIGLEWRRELAQVHLRFLTWHSAADAESQWDTGDDRVSLIARRRDVGALAALERTTPRSTERFGVRIERSSAFYEVDSATTGGPIAVLRSRTPVATVFAHRILNLGERSDWTYGVSFILARKALHGGYQTQFRWLPSRRSSVTAGLATSYQFSQSLRNPESVVGSVFPADLYMGADSSGFPIGSSHLAVVGAEYRPAAGFSTRIEGHYRYSRGLVLIAPVSGEPFSLGAYTIGSGTSAGVAIGLEGLGARYTVVATYGLQRVRFAYGSSTYVPEHGATHLAEAGMTVFPSATSSIRLGVTGAFGRRATPLSGGFEWEACNLLDQGCEFAGSPSHAEQPLGATRLPAYVRLDLGVRKHWHIAVGSRDAMIAVFGTVTNLLGRTNVMTYATDPATGQTVPVEMRPFAPLVVGLDWRF